MQSLGVCVHNQLLTKRCFVRQVDRILSSDAVYALVESIFISLEI